MATVGVIASPTAGKDVRRLVAHAGTVGDVDKISMIRRAVLGAVEGGATRLLLLPDRKHLCERAVDRLDLDATIEVLDMAVIGRGIDTVRGAEQMRKREVGAVMAFGGDGTSRDVVRGWPDAPLMPMAVGTNNVFPSTIEPTIGGLAAGMVASGALDLAEVAMRAKLIHVVLPDEERDIGLVDVVLTSDELVGSRAVWEVDDLRAALFAVAGSATIGLSSIAGVTQPCSPEDDHGIYCRFGPGGSTVRAPVAPGTYETVPLAELRSVELGASIEMTGPGTLAFDGERDHMLGAGHSVRLAIRRDGPWVIDPELALERAAELGLFTSSDS